MTAIKQTCANPKCPYVASGPTHHGQIVTSDEESKYYGKFLCDDCLDSRINLERKESK